jgi:hypothetical protein
MSYWHSLIPGAFVENYFLENAMFVVVNGVHVMKSE